MASWNECVDQVLNSGKITKTVADAIRESDDPLSVINSMMDTAKRQRREAAIQAVRIAQQWERIKNYPVDVEGLDPEAAAKKRRKYANRALMSTMVKDPTGKAGFVNVDMRQKFYENKYHSMIAEVLNKFHSRMTADPTKGFIAYDEEGLVKLTKALYGEAIDDPEIKALADQYTKMLDVSREDFNRLGGSIHKNERYVMPQNHDARTVRKYGKETWLSDIENWIDPHYMTDDFGKPLSPDDLKDGLDYAYESITTNGLNKAKDFTAPPKQGKKMARRGSEKRFLYFKDADSWTAYQNKYGRGDVYQTLVSNINNIASDMANMEVFGTNPRTSYDALVSQIDKEFGGPSGFAEERNRNLLDATFKVTSGTVDQGHMTTVADFMQGTRNVITASKLGKAIISAVSDEGFTAVTSLYNNLSYAKILGTKTAIMAGDTDIKIMAVKLGLGAESWIRAASSANRYGDVYNVGRTGKAAEVVMRASGLEPWTDAGRKAFTLEYSGYLADNFGKTFGELDDKTVRNFTTYGITEDVWDTFRKSKPLDFKGAKYANMLEEGSDKFHQMIMSEVDYAIPTPDARVRAITTGGTSSGSFTGQMVRSITNLKSFPITMLTTHGMRLVSQATRGEQISYAGMMLASTTMLGFVAMQAKDLAAGREPRPVNEDTWKAILGASISQGGGLGIFGDFLFSDVNRFGGGPIQTLFGPTGQMTSDALKLTVGNVQELFKGEDTNWGVESMRFIESNTPSIWQIQPVKNAMFDQLELLVDPKAQKRFNLARKRRQKNYDQGYWWKPGEAAPEFMD